MAELADALDLGSSAFGRGGSNPFSRILKILSPVGSEPAGDFFVLGRLWAECPQKPDTGGILKIYSRGGWLPPRNLHRNKGEDYAEKNTI